MSRPTTRAELLERSKTAFHYDWAMKHLKGSRRVWAAEDAS